MRHSTLLLTVLALGALTACNKEPNAPETPSDNNPVEEPAKEAVPFTFNGVFGESVLDTKTEISEQTGGNAQVLWKTTDKVSVFDGEGNNCEFSADAAGASTSLSGMLVPSSTGKYYAVYPYNASSSISSTTVSTTLPSEQTVSAPGFADGAVLSAAVAESASFSFNNLVALVRFTVPAEMTTLHSVTLTSTNPLSGPCTVSFASSPVIASAAGSSLSVTLTAPGTDVLAPGNYYAAILPGSHKLTVTLTDTDGKSEERSMTDAKNFVASHIRSIGSVKSDTFYNDVDFVLGDAAVGGETKTLVYNARIPAGTFTLQQLLSVTSYSFKGDKAIYVIGNKSFTVASSSVKQTITVDKADLTARHLLVRSGDDLQATLNAAEAGLDDVYVGAGTFTGGFTMVEGINVTGSWDSDFTATSTFEPLVSCTAGAPTTILDGGSSQRVLNQDANFTATTATTWKNVRIQNGKAATAAGAYLMAYGILDGCEICNNASTGDGGGMIGFNWATATKCYFHNNTAGGSGGGIITRYVLSYSVVDSNQAKGSGGAYVYAGGYSGENVERPRIFNCIISNNKATNDNGGGVRANRGNSNPLPVLYNLLVVGNTATGWAGSGILVNAGCVYNCTVVKNYTSAATQDNANALYNATNYSTDTEKGRIQACIAYGNWTGGKDAASATQIYMNSTGGLRNNSTSANGLWKAKAAYEYVTKKTVVDNFFTDFAGGDYTLSGNDADCISGGTLNGLSALWTYLPKVDLAGNNRLYNGDTQIGRGCYQYQ